MFRKKETLKSTNRDIPARLVKKDGVTTDLGGYVHQQSPGHTHRPPKYVNENAIPANDISESYVSGKQSNRIPASAPNSVKGVRRKFAPFLSRKKKNALGNQRNYENVDPEEEEDVTDIACYEDLVAEQESINPVILGQLDDSQLNTIEAEPFEEVYKDRLDFVLTNYRKPPPYPGTKATKQNVTPVLQSDVDAPLIRQLLKDKRLNDNASMNNLWHASAAHHSNVGQEQQNVQQSNGLYPDSRGYINDKLVSRTQDIVSAKSQTSNYVNVLNAGQLYEQRKQYYMHSLTNLKDVNQTIYEEPQRDTMSAVYPAKDYENSSQGKGIPMSASVPNLSVQSEFVSTSDPAQRQPRDASDMEAMFAHYRKSSLDSFVPYEMHSSSSESVSLYSQGSPSYVPPSPYLNEEIPEWLQVYAKASPDLDQYLKWGMFRYPELDCWQTMLKRLYKKELEQVVLWFEEYRLALQKELENRKFTLAYKDSAALKKTEV